jgi:hypothetical protein
MKNTNEELIQQLIEDHLKGMKPIDKHSKQKNNLYHKPVSLYIKKRSFDGL